MTKKELIELLEHFDDDMEVKFAYNAGDYWRTQVAKDISDAEEGSVIYSDYHMMDKVDDDGEEEGSKMVILLS